MADVVSFCGPRALLSPPPLAFDSSLQGDHHEEDGRMQMNITFRNFDASDALKERAHEKLEKVKKYFDRPIEAHLVLSLERHIHHADLTVHSGSFTLGGKGKSENMYHSIDLAVEHIETQLRRSKEKLKNHHDPSFEHHQEKALTHLAEKASAEDEEAEPLLQSSVG
jgi:putative sigma-54 modulation protein